MDWQVDLAHTQISFSIRHLGISLIRGDLRPAEVTLYLDEEQPESASLRALIDVSTLDTHDPSRDTHLKGPDFFNVDQYPYIEFVSEEVKRVAEGRFKMTGRLKIRDVERGIELTGTYRGPVDDPVSGKRKLGFDVTGEIAQKDWGIDWNVPMPGGFMLADRVTLTINAQAVEAS